MAALSPHTNRPGHAFRREQERRYLVGARRAALSGRKRATVPLLETNFSTYWKLAGTDKGSEAALVAAIGGSISGITWTIGPQVVGDEMVQNPNFDTDVSGWTAYSYAGNLPIIAWNAGTMTVDSNSGNLPAAVQVGTFRPGHTYAISAGVLKKAVGTADNFFLVRCTERAAADNPNSGTGLSIGMGPSTTGGVSKSSRFTAVMPRLDMACTDNTTGSPTGIGTFDTLSVKEIVPFVGFDPDKALKLTVSFTTSAALAADKVLLGTSGSLPGNDAANEEKVELVHRASDGHLIVRIATRQGQNFFPPTISSIDLGAVALSTPATVVIDCASPVQASLNGGAAVRATRGARPAVAAIYLARTVYAGSVFDGTRSYLKMEYSTRAEGRVFVSYTDSIGAGTGASSLGNTSYMGLLSLNDSGAPALWINKGIGGELAAATLARVLRDPPSQQLAYARRNVWIIQTGINSVSSQTAVQIAASVKSISDAIYAWDPAAKVIICGMYIPRLTTSGGYDAPNAINTLIMAANAIMASDHGSRFFDAHAWMMANGLTLNSLSPDATDTADAAANGGNGSNWISHQLVGGDNLHPNDFGHFAYYKGVQAQVVTAGY